MRLHADPLTGRVCSTTGRAIAPAVEPLHRVDQATIDGPESIAYQMTCRDCVWTATRPTEDEARQWASTHATNVRLMQRAEFPLSIVRHPRKAG